MKIFSFSKKFRLKKSNNYNKVFKKSYKIQKDNLIILGSYNNLNFPRLGISISKKIIPSSCKRNIFKRIAKESFRIKKNYLIKMDFIITIKKNFLFINKKELTKILNQTWIRYYNIYI
ncbi:ribonuclease P protein component [Buchnera aphidicola (Kurisakia onigurumii)]|uniref:ribonuclease P protein component n=1 Tax=Buchnera aphidicola TaxID=9 RepID=UPI0031B67FE7